MTNMSIDSSLPDIRRFFGVNRFLSNFYPVSIAHWGLNFYHVEGAYVAGKTTDDNIRKHIASVSCPREVKHLGQKIKIREDWANVRVPLMEILLRKKFSRGSSLALKLLSTGQVQLVEGNHWGDTFWGECHGFGENQLGKLLMRVRDELRTIQN